MICPAWPRRGWNTGSKDKMPSLHAPFAMAAILYTMAWCTSMMPSPAPAASIPLFVLAILANLLSDAARYYHSWPFLPMYQMPFFLPSLVGILLSGSVLYQGKESRWLLGLLALLSLGALFFPKDFYLPFWKSRTIFSHIFFLTGVMADACFIISGLLALSYLKDRGTTRPIFNHWAIWGFALDTLSIFSGEIWSYLGWGSPVVWDDPLITLSMSTWFYYGCYLHLDLLRGWGMRRRALAAVLGAGLVVLFQWYPNLGPFSPPDINGLMRWPWL